MRVLLFLVIILLTACRDVKEVPGEVLAQEKMSSILVDIHLLEAKMDQLGLSLDSGDVLYAHLQGLIFEEYGTDSLQYQNSLLYYLQNPGKMESVYNVVIDSLMLREKEHRIE
ncbi:MAG: DUF4296 domain-containing protein [Cyclobacteriaceae bacterium]